MTAAMPSNLGLRNLAVLWRLGERAVLILALLVAGGAFSLQLSGLDPHAPVGPDSASLRSRVVLGCAFAVLFLFGARGWRRVGVLIGANPFLLALPALAMLSALWAPEPAVALRRALAFGATILGALAVVAYRPGIAALRLVVQATAAGVVLSLAYLVAVPDYGVHQIADGAQSVHAGDWRGVFVHRTALGQLAALSLALTLYGGRASFPHWTLRVGALAMALACLIGANSGGGWTSAALLVATPWLFRLGLALIARGRGIGAALLGALGILAALAMPALISLALELLNKDPTLTGRTEFWRLMLRAAAERPLWGYGYSTGFRDGVAPFVEAHSRFGYIPNAQNGYLDAVLNLGLVGLGFVLAIMASAFRRAIRLALATASGGAITLVPLLIVVFMAEMNGIEAETVSANDLFMLVYVIALAASGDLIGGGVGAAQPAEV